MAKQDKNNFFGKNTFLIYNKFFKRLMTELLVGYTKNWKYSRLLYNILTKPQKKT